MRVSGGVEWALHCCVVLSVAGEPVPSSELAALHDVSPSYLAKQLQSLSKAGIIRSAQGKAGGYQLAKSDAQTTVLEIVQAVDGAQPAFVCTEIRQRGPLAAPAAVCTQPCAISRAMHSAETAWRAALAAVTIADLARQVEDDYPGDVLGGMRTYLQVRRADSASYGR